MDFNFKVKLTIRRFDVNVLEKTQCVQKKFWKFVCASRLKSDLSITVCSWLSFLKQVSSLMVGAFSCYNMLTTLPYIFNKINVIKIVKVTLELFKLDKHPWNIEEHFIPYLYLCSSKLYGPIVMSFMLHFKLLPLTSLKLC